MRLFAWLLVAIAPLTATQGISKSARCGPSFGVTCKGSRFGDCCSQYSYCGSTEAYCGRGCQGSHGLCKNSVSSLPAQPSSTAPATRIAPSSAPLVTLKVTTNARCGNLYNASPKGMTCLGSKYGDCCSQYSYCGSTDAYCGIKCQSAFGRCKDNSSRSSSSLRSSTMSILSPSSSSIHAMPSVFSSSTSSTGLSSLPASSSSHTPATPSVVASSSTGSDVSTTSSSTAFASTASSGLSSSFPTPLPSSELSTATPSIGTSSSDTLSLVSSSVTSSIAILISTPASLLTMESMSVSDLSSLGLAGSSTASSETIHSTTVIVSGVLSSSSFTDSETFTSADAISTTSLLSFTTSSDFSLSTNTITESLISASTSATTASSVDLTIKESVTMTSDVNSSLPTTASSVSSDISATSSSADISPSATSPAISITQESESSITTSTSSAMSSSDSSSTQVMTNTPTATSESSTISASSTVAHELGCNPRPSVTCNRMRDCPVATNALVAPSSTYLNVPVATASSVPYQNITVPINNLTVGNEYVLTFYSISEKLLITGSNSCCNITAYMDSIPISRYCVGYYWSLAYLQNGPYDDNMFKLLRSPAVVYRPTVPNPILQINVICPVSDSNVIVGGIRAQDIALVPRCTCVEENQFQSLQTQPRNVAFNGNFADYDIRQENPVLGWISQESWRGQVVPVPFSGPAQAGDTSTKGAVVLNGPFASLYRTVSDLTPLAPYNLSILSSSPTRNNCNLTVKFDEEIVLALPHLSIGPRDRLNPYWHNFTLVYPKATTGVLWVGNICKFDFNATRRANEYNSARIDDVSLVRVGCDDPTESISTVTSIATLLTAPTGS